MAYYVDIRHWLRTSPGNDVLVPEEMEADRKSVV